MTRDGARTYTLLGADGKSYQSPVAGTLGGQNGVGRRPDTPMRRGVEETTR